MGCKVGLCHDYMCDQSRCRGHARGEGRRAASTREGKSKAEKDGSESTGLGLQKRGERRVWTSGVNGSEIPGEVGDEPRTVEEEKGKGREKWRWGGNKDAETRDRGTEFPNGAAKSFEDRSDTRA